VQLHLQNFIQKLENFGQYENTCQQLGEKDHF